MEKIPTAAYNLDIRSETLQSNPRIFLGIINLISIPPKKIPGDNNTAIPTDNITDFHKNFGNSSESTNLDSFGYMSELITENKITNPLNSCKAVPYTAADS